MLVLSAVSLVNSSSMTRFHTCPGGMQPGPGCGLPGAKAKQEAVVAPFVQVQSHGPLSAPLWSVTAEAIAPAAHSMLAGGGALVVVLLAEPHRLVVPPVFGAEQEAVLP